MVAIGNENHGNTSSPGNAYNALSVGAVEKGSGKKVEVAAFSSGASLVFPGQEIQALVNKPDVVAPGAQVYSCIPPTRARAGSSTTSSWTGPRWRLRTSPAAWRCSWRAARGAGFGYHPGDQGDGPAPRWNGPSPRQPVGLRPGRPRRGDQEARSWLTPPEARDGRPQAEAATRATRSAPSSRPGSTRSPSDKPVRSIVLLEIGERGRGAEVICPGPIERPPSTR